MTFYQAAEIVNNAPVLSADGACDTITISSNFTTVAGMVTGEIIEMAPLPAGYVPIEALVAYNASVATAFTADCGLLSGDYGTKPTVARTMGNEAFAANSTGQGAAGLVRSVKADLSFVAPSDNDRGIGLKIVGTLTTLVVGTKIQLNLVCRPAINGA